MALEEAARVAPDRFRIITQVGFELYKAGAQPRTWASFGGMAGAAAIMFLLCNLPVVQATLSHTVTVRGYDPRQYLSGLTYALLMLRTTMLVLGALFIALFAGESVAREVEDGSMRMLLCRPVTRFQVLSAKAIALVVQAFALTGFVGGVALGLGLLFKGTGGMLAYGPVEKLYAIHSFHDGLLRYFMGLPLLALSLCTVAAFAFLLSCFQVKPAAATAAALSFFFVDYVFSSVPFFESIRPCFLNSHMGEWLQIFQPAIPWDKMLTDYTLLLAIDASLFVIAWAHFEQRDLKA